MTGRYDGFCPSCGEERPHTSGGPDGSVLECCMAFDPEDTRGVWVGGERINNEVVWMNNAITDARVTSRAIETSAYDDLAVALGRLERAREKIVQEKFK